MGHRPNVVEPRGGETTDRDRGSSSASALGVCVILLEFSRDPESCHDRFAQFADNPENIGSASYDRNVPRTVAEALANGASRRLWQSQAAASAGAARKGVRVRRNAALARRRFAEGRKTRRRGGTALATPR